MSNVSVPRRLITAMALLLVLSASAAAAIRWPFDEDDSVYPRVIVTVTALDRRGLATVVTQDGLNYEVVAGTGWRVGDTLTCTQSDRLNIPDWKRLECRKY